MKIVIALLYLIALVYSLRPFSHRSSPNITHDTNTTLQNLQSFTIASSVSISNSSTSLKPYNNYLKPHGAPKFHGKSTGATAGGQKTITGNEYTPITAPVPSQEYITPVSLASIQTSVLWNNSTSATLSPPTWTNGTANITSS